MIIQNLLMQWEDLRIMIKKLELLDQMILDP